MINDWRIRLQKAILRVENRRRAETNKPPYPEDAVVFIPEGTNVDLWLLNIRVWCLRYYVSPEFVVEAVTRRMQYERQKVSETSVALGMTAVKAGGAKARQFVEDEVKLQYPSGENQKVAQQPEPPQVRIKPYITLNQMVSDYSQAVEEAQRKHQHKIRLMSRIPLRPYRQSPKENV
jgi:hypothetical protein